MLILTLGLRRGQVPGLRWADVDLEAEEVRTGRRLQRINGRLQRETKTEASDAALPLVDIGTTAPWERRRDQEAARENAPSGRGPTSRVRGAPSNRGTPTPASRRHATRRACAGFTGKTCARSVWPWTFIRAW
ncbi:hypothetical protein GCM10022416_27780 [Actinomadura keratinilytica]|uniref:Tyr recombinase domain-containing protein n=1 Tax=Actinomadura keratinilytica TaxID=547461 RepID=A0ABP7YSC2_9ACTN